MVEAGTVGARPARGLDSFERRVYRVERVLAVASLAVMLVTVAASVAIRYFNLPLPNVAEWAVVAMAPLTFVGGAMCSYLQAHIAVDVVKLVKNSAVRRLARGIVALAMLGFSGVYVALARALFMDAVRSNEKMLDMGTPVYVAMGFLLLGMVLMTFHGAMELWRVLIGAPAPIGEEVVT